MDRSGSYHETFDTLREAVELSLDRDTSNDHSMRIRELLENHLTYLSDVQSEIDELQERQNDFEHALAEFVDLFAHSPIGLVTLTNAYAICKINEAACDLIGARASTVEGQSFERFLRPASLTDFTDACSRALTSRAAEVAEVQIRGHADSGRWTELSVRFVERPANRCGHESFLVSLSGISKQKNAEMEASENDSKYRLMLREVQHRAKNDIQLALSFLSVQAFASADAEVKKILADTESRLRAMALVYTKLYQPDSIENVNVREIIEVVVTAARNRIDASDFRFVVLADDCLVPSNVAVTIGLVSNELVTNAIVHGAVPGRVLDVEVISRCFEHDADSGTKHREMYLSVSDNGSGMPVSNANEHTDGFGLTVVRDLVGQHGGHVSVNSTPPHFGTTCAVQIPLD